MTYYYDDELYHYDDELYHYGVKGMKWGIRKARRSIGNGISRIRRKASGFYKKHKRAINTAAGIAGAAALGYGAYRLDRATGGRGAKLARNAYGAARSAAGNVYNSARSAAGNAYRAANKKAGNYYYKKASMQNRLAIKANQRANDYAARNYTSSQRVANRTAGQRARKYAKYIKRAHKYYSRSL